MKRQIYHDLYHATEYLAAALKVEEITIIKTEIQLAQNMLLAALKREMAIRRKDDKRNQSDSGMPTDRGDHNVAGKK